MAVSDGLILICVLNKHFEMRETHHRTQPCLVIGQLIESPAEFIGQEIKRGIEAVVNIFLAQFFPHMLNGVDFWAVGRLLDQANGAWNDQLSRAMPPSITLPASR